MRKIAVANNPSRRDISDFFEKAENIDRSEGIETAEENWRGGLADFGDNDAALKIVRMPGYFDYFSQLEELAFENLGDTFECIAPCPTLT